METLVLLEVSIVLPLIQIMEVKERILIKADELFMQYGIRSISMDDIATQLGMSKKTIYQFFVDKDELVDAVVDTRLKKMQNDCTTSGKEAQDAIHEIFIMMDRVIDQFINMNPMLLYDLEKFHFNRFKNFWSIKTSFFSGL